MAFETGETARRHKSVLRFKTALEDMSAEELNESMAHFVFEVKKQDGQEYPRNFLYGLVCEIQRYLRTQCESSSWPKNFGNKISFKVSCAGSTYSSKASIVRIKYVNFDLYTFVRAI